MASAKEMTATTAIAMASCRSPLPVPKMRSKTTTMVWPEVQTRIAVKPSAIMMLSAEPR
jgi:hypothetical protein